MGENLLNPETLTQVRNHMHHPSDMIANTLIGTFQQVINKITLVVQFLRLVDQN